MAEALFEKKEKLYALKQQIQAAADEIAKMGNDFSIPYETLKARVEHRDSLAAQYAELKKEHDETEAKQMEQVKNKFTYTGGNDSETIKAKATFYRAAFAGGAAKSYAGLGAVPAADPDLAGGDRFLPTNLSNEIIVEPKVENPLRAAVRMSNVTGLEEPRLAFTVDGAYDDITDKETAKEIEMKGDSVVYGRHKVKVMARVSDTVIHGTDTNLVTEIENGLRNGLAVNELARMFAKEPT